MWSRLQSHPQIVSVGHEILIFWHRSRFDVGNDQGFVTNEPTISWFRYIFDWSGIHFVSANQWLNLRHTKWSRKPLVGWYQMEPNQSKMPRNHDNVLVSIGHEFLMRFWRRSRFRDRSTGWSRNLIIFWQRSRFRDRSIAQSYHDFVTSLTESGWYQNGAWINQRCHEIMIRFGSIGHEILTFWHRSRIRDRWFDWSRNLIRFWHRSRFRWLIPKWSLNQPKMSRNHDKWYRSVTKSW